MKHSMKGCECERCQRSRERQRERRRDPAVRERMSELARERWRSDPAVRERRRERDRERTSERRRKWDQEVRAMCGDGVIEKLIEKWEKLNA